MTDKKGKPRGEFFVLCFTGSEDAKVASFLTAEDALRNFKEATGDMAGNIALPGKAVFTDVYIVRSQTSVLERIEQSLKYADIISNRQFVLSGLQGTSINPHTDPLYEEPIFNPHASIPEAFTEFKKMATHAMCKVEDFYDLLLKIASSSDPETALATFEKIRREGYGVSVKYDFGSMALYDALPYHKEAHEALTKLRLLKPFVALQDAVTNEVVARTASGLTLAEGTVRVLSVRYDPKTLQIEGIEIRLDGTENVKTLANKPSVVSTKPGEIVIFSKWRDFVAESSFRVCEQGMAELPPEERARQCSWMLVWPFLHEVYCHLIGHLPGILDLDYSRRLQE